MSTIMMPNDTGSGSDEVLDDGKIIGLVGGRSKDDVFGGYYLSLLIV